MKFAVGYQLPEEGEETLVNIVKDFRQHIEEIYFPWLDIPTARMSLVNSRGSIDWGAQGKLEKDLEELRRLGVKLNLLLNANCYGRYSVSQNLANLVCSIISRLRENVGGLDAVTTTSLSIAHVVKENFKDVEVRASVNMCIGTVKGMQYVSSLFDGFHIQREYNRDLEKIKELKEWADRNGKRLYILANSGCLNYCSGQIFHDNLVAHETEIAETVNINWNPILCWNFYKNIANQISFLQGSWIRPEDVHRYEEYFPVIKLATRMHANPRMVIQAYVEQRFAGNLLDLMEPGYSTLFSPYIVDNSRFPEDWFDRTTRCDKRCHFCDYCRFVLNHVLVDVSKLS